LLGGKQASLELASSTQTSDSETINTVGHTCKAAVQRPAPLPERLHEADLISHEKYIEKMGENALWKKYN